VVPFWFMIAWQAYLSTTFQVSLDTVNHILLAREEVVYPNTSPDSLPFVWVHLYPNAYRKTSIYAQEAAKRGDFRIHRANPKDLGGITISKLRINSSTACSVITLPYPARHQLAHPPTPPGCVLRIVDTEGQIWLPEPLPPGETLRLTFTFTVHIPIVFSRMGRQGRTYILSQWYPKMVVYDRIPPKAPPLDLPEAAWRGPKGFWHPDGYHHEGEFYGEFGTFWAEITVPAGFVVGATGTLIAHFHQDSLEVYRFRADSVHDFAFAASPDFTVMETTWQHVTLRALVQPQNRKLYEKIFPEIPVMLERYSTWFGPYRYPVLTVVDGHLRGGEGMEYPTLVVIGKPWGERQLREVLAHEIAHQWFYGMYANNEMDEAWLDESWTSWATDRFMDWWEKQHPDTAKTARHPGFPFARLFSSGNWGMLWRKAQGIYLYRYAAGPDNEPVAGPPAYRMKAYFPTIYEKGSRVVHYTERYLGDSLFQEYLRTLYGKKAMRHLHIADVREILRQMGAHPERFLDPQLFDVVRDVRFGKVIRTDTALWVRLAYDGPPIPVEVRGIADGNPLTRWVDTAWAAFPPEVQGLELDPEDVILEANEWNNRWGGPPAISKGFIHLPEVSPSLLSVWGFPVVLWGSEQGITPGFVTVWTQGTVRHTGALYGGYGTRSRRGEGALVWMEPPFLLVLGNWQGSNDQNLTLWPLARALAFTLFRERVFDTTHVNPQVYEPGEQAGLRLRWNHGFSSPRFGGRLTVEVALARTVLPRRGTYGKLTTRFGGKFSRVQWVAAGRWANGTVPRQERFFLQGEGREVFPWSLLIPSRGPWATTGKYLTLGEGLGGFGGLGLSGTRWGMVGMDFPVKTSLFLYARAGWMDGSRTYAEGGPSLHLGLLDLRFPVALRPPSREVTWDFRFYVRLREVAF